MKSGLSIVIPVYNEEDNIASLHREIVSVCRKNRYRFEIIMVDDGSTDRTAAIIKKLTPVTLIRLRKNFGQTAAMDAGIKEAKNGLIITMDGDGQNDPQDIPALIAHLEEQELDVVSGWRKKRRDPFFKRFVSRGANLLRRIFINDGIHDSGCSLKVYRKICFEDTNLYGEMHRFIPGLLKMKGFKIGEIVVNHRPRKAGITKYNWKRTLKGLLDMFALWFWRKYAVRPLHMLGVLGMILLLLGFGCGVASLVLFFKGKDMSDTIFPLLTAFFLISGIQVFIFGLLADMLSKNYYNQTGQSYSVSEVFTGKPKKKR